MIIINLLKIYSIYRRLGHITDATGLLFISKFKVKPEVPKYGMFKFSVRILISIQVWFHKAVK